MSTNGLFQPATTDTTAEGARRARNAMRLRLWADDRFAARWLMSDGGETPDPARVALYQTEIEEGVQ